MPNLRKGAHRRLFLLLGALFPAAAVAGSLCPAEQVDELASVSYVHDGDTVHLEDGRKVRLIGINTPERARDGRPEQAYAQAARAFLLEAIAPHDHRVALVYGKERRDRHQRTLAHLFSPDGDNLQARLLEQGLAAAIAHPPNITYTDCYARHEKAARCAGRGIWSHPQYAALHDGELSLDDTGFQRVSGTIEHVSETAKGIWLFMSELMLGVRRQDLGYFDTTELLALAGKRLTVRGWLQPARKKTSAKTLPQRKPAKYFMRIRHPSAIEMKTTGDETKC